ncbi:PQQ-binding-like beta-propeller repeat protein [Maioricimonas sp. JC845]|uniref:outer membrane protein assembly factor BamB family protein n=1 Tax=Maioricimonas sp. JC845 TaxID=3232138 RepID=UPI003458EABD
MRAVSRRRLIQFGLGLVCVAVTGTSLHAADLFEGPAWPDFRNGSTLQGIARGTLPDNLQLLWEVTTPDGVTSTPAIAEGRVYAGTISGDLFCLDLKTGKPFWKYHSIESTDPDEFAPGFLAPVSIDASTVFVGDDSGVFHAVERATGKKRWTFETDGEIIGGATLLGEGRVMVGSHDGRLYCLERKTGKEVWQFDTQGPINGSQALAGQFTFVTGCDKPILRVVNVDGGTEEAEIPIESLLIASPALRGDQLYFGTDSGEVIAMNWKDQSIAWTYADPNRQQQIHSSPAVTEDVVVIGSRDKRIHCIDRATGKSRWTYATRAKIDCSPVIAGNRVVFGSADKNLYMLNLEDGSEVWKYNTGQAVTGSPAVAGGYMVIGTDQVDGRILCFGPKP